MHHDCKSKSTEQANKMTPADTFCPQCGASMESREQKNPGESSPSPEKQADRETDHRGVLMPRRTRIGGIIMPQ